MSTNMVSTLTHHYSMSMSYHPRPGSVTNSLPRNGTIASQRNAAHRASMNSLPSRRSMKRDQSRSRGARSSTRSTASARRRKRMQRSNHHPNNNLPYDTDFEGSSVYQSQNQLINHYDASSLDSFNPGGAGHTNPLYGGSIQSTGSRFSVYTIDPHASTVERINVADSHAVLNNQSSSSQHQNNYNQGPSNSFYETHPSHHHQEYGHSRQPPQGNHQQQQAQQYGTYTSNGITGHSSREGRRLPDQPQPATIGRRSLRRPRSPIYMNSHETSM